MAHVQHLFVCAPRPGGRTTTRNVIYRHRGSGICVPGRLHSIPGQSCDRDRKIVRNTCPTGNHRIPPGPGPDRRVNYGRRWRRDFLKYPESKGIRKKICSRPTSALFAGRFFGKSAPKKAMRLPFSFTRPDPLRRLFTPPPHPAPWRKIRRKKKTFCEINTGTTEVSRTRNLKNVSNTGK